MLILILALVDEGARGLVTMWAARAAPYIGSPAREEWWEAQPLWIQVFAALCVGEIGGFSTHWLLHVRHLPFWPLHRVHHAVRRLYVLNTYRFHPIDLALQLLCIHPLLALAGLRRAPVVFYYTVWFNTVGQLSHWNIRTRCGPLNYVFNTPECHRYHHSRSISDANCNYGQVLLIYDLLFGTFVACAARGSHTRHTHESGLLSHH